MVKTAWKRLAVAVAAAAVVLGLIAAPALAAQGGPFIDSTWRIYSPR